MAFNNNWASNRKLAQLHLAIGRRYDIGYFQRILQKESDIEYEPSNCNKVAISADCSLLHTAYSCGDFEKFKLLLEHGVDLIAEDSERRTIVQKIFQEQFRTRESYVSEYDNKCIDLVLSAHVKYGNGSNPRSKHNVSHFHVACARNNVEAVAFFLESGVDANETVNVDSPIFAGYAPLHFAVAYSCLRTLQILLRHGAKLHLKNASGMSPLDVATERKINGKIWQWKDTDEAILGLLAKRYLNINDNATSADAIGLSELHIACILNDTSVLEDILETITHVGIIDRALPMDAAVWPGYTPLHFAALLSANAVKLLMKKGANIQAKDSRGVTPFDLCLRERSVEDIREIISSKAEWKDVSLSDGKTRLLDLVSASTSADEFAKFLANFESIAELTVPVDSPLWPGYTILHLLVVFSEKAKHEPSDFGLASDAKKVEECFARGAKITKADANNSTALHLAVYSGKFHTLQVLLRHHFPVENSFDKSNIAFHLGFYLHKLRPVQALLKHHSSVENPFDGNNLSHFHIACAARDESVVKGFLSNGADVNVPIASAIEWRASSPSDCKARSLYLAPGSTALHVNVVCGNARITKMLLNYGADVYAKDVNGFTPIHLLFSKHIDEGIAELLLGISGLKDSAAKCGLTHLHVACHLRQIGSVKTLVNNGADVNAVVTTTEAFDVESLPLLSKYNGFTPLHFSLGDILILIFLLKKGSHILACTSPTCVPAQKIGEASRQCDNILPIVMNDAALQNQLKAHSGLTMLHIACYANKPKLANDLLLQGEDVNAQVDKKSPFGPGNTPLHFAATNGFVFVFVPDMFETFKVLLSNGANVSLTNANGDTALHLLNRLHDGPLTDSEGALVLLNSLKEFDVDAAHSQGISLFHFACLLKNLSVVQGFLKNGIDVNKAVDYFDNRYPGCSPLHLAAGYLSESSSDAASQLQIVELLLEYGADVRAKDAEDNTPLHNVAAVSSSRQIFFEIFIRNGVDVNAENLLGQTALELLMKSRNPSWEEVECLLKHGSSINSYNPVTHEGHMMKVVNNYAGDMVRKLIDSKFVDEVDGEGRTFLHNLVSGNNYYFEYYAEFIGQLVKRGFDVNRQDNEGRTALHAAALLRNHRGILGLMKNGADVNVTDKKGKTAYAYSVEAYRIESYSIKSARDRYLDELENDRSAVIKTFTMHLYKMESCGLYISEVNKRLKVDALEMMDHLDQDSLNRFDDDVRKSKDIRIGSSALTLYDFGFKIDFDMMYLNIPFLERLEIEQFFKDIYRHNLHELDYLLKLKYEHAVERLRLIDLAIYPFMTLIKNQLPDLCCRVILSFLPSNDLQNVIALENL